MVSAESSLRVAIGGLHRMLKPDLAHHNWAAAFAAVSETHVVAAYDRVAATREEFQARWRDTWGDIPMYDDFPGMIEESRPDILMLSTGHWNHADHIELAVRAGVRGILCEKPFVTSMAEADRILATCTEAKVPLAFGLDRRWSDDYLTLRALLSDGAIGTVTGVAAFGVPNLINHGCHSFDMALALAGDGEPTWASGFVDKLPEDEPPDSHRPLDPTRARLGGAGQWHAFGDRAGVHPTGDIYCPRHARPPGDCGSGAPGIPLADGLQIRLGVAGAAHGGHCATRRALAVRPSGRT